MIENVFLVNLIPIDEDTIHEVFGVFSDIEKVETAIKQFSSEIETELIENTHYEISKIALNKSNYISTK